MKKTFVIILSIVLCVALAGVAVAVGGSGKIFNADNPTLETTEKATNSKNEEPTESQEADSTAKIETEEVETLSAEDKALKAEIAKISDTRVDFRTNKNQIFLGKKYNLVYKEINTLFNDEGTEKIDYIGKTEEGYEVEFIYNIKDGKLFVANINIPKTQKQDTSISIEEAENLARKYAAEYCDLNVYSLSHKKERANEYVFVFTKCIEGYSTADQVDVEIDFQGNLIYLRNNTGVFDEFEIESIDETKLLETLESKIDQDMEYTIDDQRIVVEDGQVMMEYSICPSDSRGFICLIPIE